MIHEALKTHLASKSAVASLLTTSGVMRFYPGVIPQTDKGRPVQTQIMYRRPSTYRVKSMTGASNLAKTRIELNCWASKFITAHALAEQIRLAIDGYQGYMGSVYVNSASIADQDDAIEVAIGSEVERAFNARLELELWHYESSPTL